MSRFPGQPPSPRGARFWAIQCPGWLLLVYLVVAQGLSAFSYELGVAIGVQEPARQITAVGAAFWYGFAFGDALVYIPLLLAGLIGHLKNSRWGRTCLAAALGVTIYWPLVCLAALVDARGASGWNIPSELPYWLVLPLIAIWGIMALWLLMRMPAETSVTEEY